MQRSVLIVRVVVQHSSDAAAKRSDIPLLNDVPVGVEQRRLSAGCWINSERSGFVDVTAYEGLLQAGGFS